MVSNHKPINYEIWILGLYHIIYKDSIFKRIKISNIMCTVKRLLWQPLTVYMAQA